MRRLLSSPLAYILSALFVVILCISLYFNQREIRQSTHQLSKLEREVSIMADEVTELERETQVATSTAAKEKIFRNELLMQKPGEYIVQVPDLPIPSPMPKVIVKPLKPWQQWKKLLFN